MKLLEPGNAWKCHTSQKGHILKIVLTWSLLSAMLGGAQAWQHSATDSWSWKILDMNWTDTMVWYGLIWIDNGIMSRFSTWSFHVIPTSPWTVCWETGSRSCLCHCLRGVFHDVPDISTGVFHRSISIQTWGWDSRWNRQGEDHCFLTAFQT